jgi:hypothetical protein
VSSTDRRGTAKLVQGDASMGVTNEDVVGFEMSV